MAGLLFKKWSYKKKSAGKLDDRNHLHSAEDGKFISKEDSEDTNKNTEDEWREGYNEDLKDLEKKQAQERNDLLEDEDVTDEQEEELENRHKQELKDLEKEWDAIYDRMMKEEKTKDKTTNSQNSEKSVKQDIESLFDKIDDLPDNVGYGKPISNYTGNIAQDLHNLGSVDVSYLDHLYSRMNDTGKFNWNNEVFRTLSNDFNSMKKDKEEDKKEFTKEKINSRMDRMSEIFQEASNALNDKSINQRKIADFYASGKQLVENVRNYALSNFASDKSDKSNNIKVSSGSIKNKLDSIKESANKFEGANYKEQKKQIADQVNYALKDTDKKEAIAIAREMYPRIGDISNKEKAMMLIAKKISEPITNKEVGI